MTKTVLILVDIQNDYFAGGRMALPGMEAAATKAATILDMARDKAYPILHIRHIAPADAPFFRKGTEGSEIHVTVAPRDGERVVEKARPNSFVGTGLDDILRADGVEHLIICGAMSQMCIDATTRAAADLGYKVTLVSDACAAAAVSFDGVDVSADQVHAAIMAPLAARYATVVKAADLSVPA